MSDLLAMTATVIDRASGPLADIQKNMQRMARGSARDLRGTNDVLYEFGRGLRNVAIPALQAFGVTSLSVGGAVGALALAMRNMARDSLPMKHLANELKLATGDISNLKLAAEALGAGDVTASLRTFTDLMRNYHDQTRAARDMTMELHRMGAGNIADELDRLSKLGDTAAQLDGLTKIFERLATAQDKALLSAKMLGSPEAYRAFSRQARELIKDLEPLVSMPEQMAVAYTKSLLEIDRSFENLKRTVLIGVMPVFQEWADAFNRWAKENKDDVASGAVSAFQQLATHLRAARQELEALGKIAEGSGLGWLADRLGPEPKEPLAPYRMDPSWWEGAKRWLDAPFDPLGRHKGGATGNWDAPASDALQDPALKDEQKKTWRNFWGLFQRSGLDVLNEPGVGGISRARFMNASLGGIGGGGLAGGVFGGGAGRGLGDIGGGGLPSIAPPGAGTPGAAVPPDRAEAFKRIRDAAAAAGSPDPDTTAAIAMHESGWLSSRISREGNNPFGQTTRGPGIIGKDGQSHKVYGSLDEAVKHHVDRWGSRYGSTPEETLQGLVRGGYNTTDPRWSRAIGSIRNRMTSAGGWPRMADGTSFSDSERRMDPMSRGAPHGDFVTVTAPSGKQFRVAREFAGNFQGFLRDYEAAGGVVGPDSGGAAGRGNLSYHPTGRAIDLNQIGYGIRSKLGKTLPQDVEESIAQRWGLYPGSKFMRRSDAGHFEVRNAELARERLNRALAAQTGATKIDASGTLDVNVRAPRGTTASFRSRSSLFKATRLNRSVQMEPAPDTSWEE
ncbi:MAG: glucosaminidase domain-containing protein [Hyphomicrobiales bacterium]|nr:glucosaminidase domain-containing protein [Hyphomicrobiales bacterium]